MGRVAGCWLGCAVDFEFTGPGLAAVDLGYFFFPDALQDLLPLEAGLLRGYHAELEVRREWAGWLAAGSAFLNAILFLFCQHSAPCTFKVVTVLRHSTDC